MKWKKCRAERILILRIVVFFPCIFRAFDRNGDGFICKTEFKHCMMQFGDRFTDEEVEELIKEADINKDGKIDYEEFSKIIMDEIS